MFKSIIKLEFLRNESNKAGLIRIVVFGYFMTFFISILKHVFKADSVGFPEISQEWVWITIIMVLAKNTESLIKGLQIMKGKE